MIIIGIDPGSNYTGFGVVETRQKKCFHVASGVLTLKGTCVAGRMGAIFKGLEKVILTCKPDGAAIEKIFYHKNAESALKLGQARGAALTALAMQNLDVAEYSARQVKQAVVGYGAAAKGQVQTMVKALLDLKELPGQDAADALAIAICHANTLLNPLHAHFGKATSWRKLKPEDLVRLTKREEDL